MKRIRFVCALVFSLTALSVVLPAFASDSGASESVANEATEESNGQKIKQGAKGIFSGIKGAVKDGTHSAKEKAKEITQEAYVGEWYFANGSYATMITFENDWDFKITQTKKNGENVWTGTYEEGDEKKQLILHLVSANGKTSYKDWKMNYIAEKKDYLIVSCSNITADPNGYDFSNRTLFNYVGK
ncbi:MAG: hypothetical protein K6G18_00495 [Treponema sp.]|nr:hypothetical protein [Treponema sp.]